MRQIFQHPLVKRLPFLLLVAVGVIVFKTGYLPRSRELVWRMPDDRSIREVEVQLYDGDEHDLLKRETFNLPNGPEGDLVEHVSLGRGDYVARVFVRREGKPLASAAFPLHVTGDDLLQMPLIAR